MTQSNRHESKPGQRVEVMCDGAVLGLGTYLGHVTLTAALEALAESAGPEDSPPEHLSGVYANVGEMVEKCADVAMTPKIQLDSGRIIYGFECHWCEVPEDGASTH